MKRSVQRFLSRVTAVLAVILAIMSCKQKLGKAEDLNLEETPVQTVRDMFVVQTDKGVLQMRMEAPLMNRYKNDTCDWEVFPEGFFAYAYNEEGRLETEIKADEARHIKAKKEPEVWSAFGHVVVTNLIKRETMSTDTLYWDRENQRIYTDCYVQLLSPSGFMQGYGMESDQRARNSVLYREFNSYGLVSRDTSIVELDTINFIGPFPRVEKGQIEETASE